MQADVEQRAAASCRASTTNGGAQARVWGAYFRLFRARAAWAGPSVAPRPQTGLALDPSVRYAHVWRYSGPVGVALVRNGRYSCSLYGVLVPASARGCKLP